MDWKSYKELKKLERNCENEYVENALEDRPNSVKRFIDEDEDEIEKFLKMEDFLNNRDEEEFYRNLERYYNDELSKYGLLKALSSLQTYAYIDRDHHSVEEGFLDLTFSILQSAHEEDFEPADRYIGRFFTD